MQSIKPRRLVRRVLGIALIGGRYETRLGINGLNRSGCETVQICSELMSLLHGDRITIAGESFLYLVSHGMEKISSSINRIRVV